jgi:hypothetical protein
LIRASRPYGSARKLVRPNTARKDNRRSVHLVLLLLLVTSLLPSGAFAARQRVGVGSASIAPLVTGADYTLAAAQFQRDPSEAKENSLKGDLRLPAGARQSVFTSEATRAPVDFSDVAPRWWADTPVDTAVQVELRTSRDGKVWGPWVAADEEDIASPQDTLTQTYASIVAVDQADRTHRYVQSRISLNSARAGVTPVFHELTYTFINAGVTPKSPRPQAMAMGTPSDIPRPAMVARTDWGAPEGKSSPRWAPKYKRVTHIIIHHTATSNADTDFPARVRAIWYFHSKTRGWGDIGYNYLVDPNGIIYEGRAGGDDVEAGHAYPFNAGSMGVGMLGNYMNVAPSAAAQAALIDLISWKADQRGIDPQGSAPLKGYTTCGGTLTYTRPTIAGHRDYKGSACGKPFNNSTCPGDRLWSMLPQIRAAVIAEQPPLRATFTSHDTPGNINPGATIDVHLTVRNSGSLTWQAGGQGSVSLGYRWYTREGALVKSGWQDLRAALPGDLAFAGTVTLSAKLNAPAVPGPYAVVWDMLRDGQGWFADQGSRPLRVDVVVGKDTGDTVAPESEVLPLPMYSNSPEVTVRWAGKDDPKGSGLVSYDLQFRIIPQGPWSDWKSATADMEATFEGQDGYTYGFRSRARDAAGNVEEWRDEPDAYITIDTRPPALTVDTPGNGAHVDPGPLMVRGRTEPGTFVAVNDQRAEEGGGVYTSTVVASGRDFLIHVTAADAAGNVSRLEVTVQAAPRYNDVRTTHPAFVAIEYLSEQGVVGGYGDGSFRPEVPVTRAQLAKTLASGLHWGLIKPEEPRFSDVPPDSWMYPYVETAVARKIMMGYSDGTFAPNAPVTRGTAIRTLVLAAGWGELHAPAGHFLDVPARSRFYPFVESAFAHGIITPDVEGNLYPDAPCTRAYLSMMVYEMLSRIIEEIAPTPDDQGP